MLQEADTVAVLTGAGVSAASGIPTFRGAGGLWQGMAARQLATPAAYRREPLRVWRWYAERLATAESAEPNEAHLALARLERSKDVTVVTQNVDGLHRRAGSRQVIELHGDLTLSRCESCGQLDPLRTPLALPPHCSRCGQRSRPNVVWFGETLSGDVLEAAVAAFATCELALVVGTSGVVEPAASLAQLASDQGVVVVEVNPDLTPITAIATIALRMEAVPGLSALIP